MEFVRRAGDNVNLVVYDNIQPIVWITTVPFFIMGLISSAIRLYTRAFIRKPFGTDDWFMLVGTVSVKPTLFLSRAVTDPETDFVHRAAVYRLDVDHLRRRAVSLTLSGEKFSNCFSRHVTDPRVKPENLKKISTVRYGSLTCNARFRSLGHTY